MLNNKNISEWLDWLENYKDSNIELGLNKLLPIAEKLNLNTFNCPVIIVAGTNGKGSTVATIEAIALSLGKKVASYTSPHLFSFTERIKINGKPITENDCIASFQGNRRE